MEAANPNITKENNALAFQRGDQEALAFFYREFLPALSLYANKWVLNFSIAEEIASDAFLKVWKMHAKLDSYNAIRAYLYKIVYRDAMHYLRKENSRDRVEEASSLPDIEFNSPYDHLIRTETYRLIHSALKELTPGSQRVIKMYYLEGKSSVEIAEELNVTPGTVRNQKKQGLAVLKEKMKGFIFFIISAGIFI